MLPVRRIQAYPSLVFCAAAQRGSTSCKGTASQQESAEHVRLRVDRMELRIARNRWKQTLFMYFLVPPVAPDRSRRGRGKGVTEGARH